MEAYGAYTAGDAAGVPRMPSMIAVKLISPVDLNAITDSDFADNKCKKPLPTASNTYNLTLLASSSSGTSTIYVARPASCVAVGESCLTMHVNRGDYDGKSVALVFQFAPNGFQLITNCPELSADCSDMEDCRLWPPQQWAPLPAAKLLLPSRVKGFTSPPGSVPRTLANPIDLALEITDAYWDNAS